ncbi:MAG TPA: ABC transporter ATP-binding protein, partial [Pirellulaceae bacterium]|nr:ABC transporter ATP-binding protein [Pirellulaceae bacterium]
MSKIFPGGVVALDSLNLAVDEDELVVLVGPSGSGKSTILRLIAGLERPTQGEIRMAGSVVTQLSPRERNVAFVLQTCPLYPHLNVYGNIAFSWRMRHSAAFLTRCWRRFAWSRTTSSEDVASAGTATAEAVRVQAAAEMLGIGHLLERWPQQLSGGERQRVALARAIVRE